jgi:hypothetical protein
MYFTKIIRLGIVVIVVGRRRTNSCVGTSHFPVIWSSTVISTRYSTASSIGTVILEQTKSLSKCCSLVVLIYIIFLMLNCLFSLGLYLTENTRSLHCMLDVQLFLQPRRFSLRTGLWITLTYTKDIISSAAAAASSSSYSLQGFRLRDMLRSHYQSGSPDGLSLASVPT